jgi:hypothetical protein
MREKSDMSTRRRNPSPYGHEETLAAAYEE